MTQWKRRSASPPISWKLEQAGFSPLMARLYAARGVTSAEQVDHALQHMIAPSHMKGLAEAATLMADALEAGAHILVIGDYDCDGATATAVAVGALRQFTHSLNTTAQIDFLVPNRFRDGYGLSPAIVEQAAQRGPDLILTVDNGIASHEGIRLANELGLTVVVTDHHLPGPELPPAAAIVNPNQPGCPFPSKSLAGVGVVFYLMIATRGELRERGHYSEAELPNLGRWLDLVALGTVADVVPLDRNNRILVQQGLQRIRNGQAQPGLQALIHVTDKSPAHITSLDLGFTIGPRLNAAGRLDDMSLGISCLLSHENGDGMKIASELHRLNQERREIQQDMTEQALQQLLQLERDHENLVSTQASICCFHPDWHSGIIGILAGQIKEKKHRPCFVFARDEEESEQGGGAGKSIVRGSGRSIAGFHLRDALDRISKRHPDLLLRFGGHAAAAGVTLYESDYPLFCTALEADARAQLSDEQLEQTLWTDGSLETGYLNLSSAREILSGVWGQEFPPPLFEDRFTVVDQRLVKEKHLRLTLERQGQHFSAMFFNQTGPLPQYIRAAYRIAINDFRGQSSVQIHLEHAQEAVT